VLALVVVSMFVALRVAVARLPALVTSSLGPRASVGAIAAGWTSIELRDLAVRADRARWPAEFELRAARILVRPSWWSLLRGSWRIARIEVEGGYLSMLRTRDGRLLVLPALLERKARAGANGNAEAAASAFALTIGEVALEDSALELFDASVAGAARGVPHRLRLAELRAEVGPIALPALDERMAIDLQARFKGPRRDGQLTVNGHLRPATRDADLDIRARGIDLVALQPYLLRSGEAAVRAGTLDLTLDAKAAQQRLKAPGKLAIQGLELADGGGALSTFAGLPRQAVLAALARDGRIELDFTLEGRIDDPKFSLNELFAARFAVGLAEKLGVSLGGVVEGVGQVIKGLLGR
jgi:hypothetical protein